MAPQITLYAHKGPGPNPYKIALALTSLGLEYDVKALEFGDGPNGVKGADFLKINPNGRVPALVDHSNKDFTVWESGAILYYLAEKYDPSGKLLGKSVEEKALVQQWVYFQVSGLGPVQGNVNFAYLGYYKATHGEDAPQSFLDRFKNESKRLYGVLEDQLKKQKARGSPWIALDHPSAADYSFYPWVNLHPMAKLDLSAFPTVLEWLEKLKADEGTKKAYASIPQ